MTLPDILPNVILCLQGKMERSIKLCALWARSDLLETRVIRPFGTIRTGKLPSEHAGNPPTITKLIKVFLKFQSLGGGSLSSSLWPLRQVSGPPEWHPRTT